MLFIGLICLMFLIIIRPQDFVPAVQGLPLVFGLMVVLTAGWFISPVSKRLIRTPQDKFMAAFFVMIVISTLQVRWISYTIETAKETFKLVIIYYCIVTFVDNEKKFKIMTWIMLLFMTMVAAMGIAQYYGHDITGIGMIWASDKEVWQIRGIGNFDNPNDLAYSVVLVLPFIVGLLINSNIYLKPLAIAWISIILYCIFLTNSRGGLLTTVVSLAGCLYFWTKNTILKKLFLICSGVIILILITLVANGYREDASSMGRVEAWVTGMELLKNHPFIGVGKEQFIEHNDIDAHNSYVRVGSELGIIGLYAYLGLIYSCFKTLARPLDKKWKIYQIGYMAYLLGYTVASVFSSRPYDIVFLIVTGFISIAGRLRYMDDEVPDSGKFINMRVIVILLLVISIWKIFLVQVW